MWDFIVGVTILFIIDVVLSVDNAILIASSTKDLDGDTKKWAQMIGAAGAVLLRLIFVIIIMFTLNALAGIPLIYIIGGGLLVYIGLSLSHDADEDHHQKEGASSILKAVAIIIAGDVMMSFDNALVISEVAIGITDVLWVRVSIVAAALLLSLVIIIFFSGWLTTFMQNNYWLIYVACWLLVGVGIEMMFKDALVPGHINHWLILFISYSISGILIYIKWYFTHKWNNNKSDELETETKIQDK